jgi:hypothetical protein
LGLRLVRTGDEYAGPRSQPAFQIGTLAHQDGDPRHQREAEEWHRTQSECDEKHHRQRQVGDPQADRGSAA